MEGPIDCPTSATSALAECGPPNPGSPRIVYGVLTGSAMHQTRVPHVQQTWARRIGPSSAIAFFSDRADPSVPTIGLQPSEAEELHALGAWRNLPALRVLHDRREHFGCFDWVFFVDDDSFVFPRNLERRLAAENPAAPAYLGVHHTARKDLEWKDERARIGYAHGGAGYVLSWPALLRMRPRIDGCEAEYTGWAGDMRVGKCLSLTLNTQIPVRDYRGLHTEPPEYFVWAGASLLRERRGLWFHTSAQEHAPLSFHHLSGERMRSLAHSLVVASRGARGRVWEHDFSELGFREHRFAVGVGSEAAAGARELAEGGVEATPAGMRLLFGFAIEEARPGAPPASHGDRRSGWRTLYDHVISFERVGSDRFEMRLGVATSADTRPSARVKPTFPFPRDTCPHHPRGDVRLKHAVVRICCAGGCVAAAAAPPPPPPVPVASTAPPEHGRVTAAWLEPDGCSLALDLALPTCPPARRRFFRSLSVGTGCGSDDVARHGAARRAWRWRGGEPLAGGASGDVWFVVASELPVWVGRPEVRIDPPDGLRVEVGGSLVGPANHSLVGPAAPASLLVRAHCRSEAREDVVVRVRLAVERGEYEALRFSLLRRCELRGARSRSRATESEPNLARA